MCEPLRIFIVEDDVDARNSLSDILELDDHSVSACSTAEEAMSHEQFAMADVVLLDRKLPDGLAEELLPKLRQAAPHTEFIIVTGYADLNAAIAALRQGVSDYIIKPINPDALRTSLGRLADRRHTEQLLERQKHFDEQLLNTAEAIILVLDAQGRIVHGNGYFLELTGYTAEEIEGQDWFEMFIPETERSDVRGVFGQTVAEIKSKGIVNPIRAKDGAEYQIRWSNATLAGINGDLAILAVGLDVTDFIAAQRRLLQSERLAAIGQTVAGLAHESRNALQRLRNALNLLQQEFHDRPEVLQDLDKIDRASSHIRELLEEVRDYAAPINLEKSRQAVPEIWRRAWQTLSHRHNKQQVTLYELLPTESGNSAELEAKLDAGRMERVFRNLFENALDAAEGPLCINVRLQVTPEKCHITLSDDGPGVPASARDTLFDAFSTTKPTGTGLGLAICRRTVEAHGGTLELVNSAAGAEFAITLPRS